MIDFKEKLGSAFTAPWLAGVWPVFFRVLLGVLLIYHGASKVFEGKIGTMASMLEKRGWLLPELQAIGASYVEFAGGILLAVGLFTRPAAFANVILFSVVVFVFHGDDPFGKQEKGILFLAMSLYVFFMGPGKVAVDHFIFRKNAMPEQVERGEQQASAERKPQASA